MPTVFNEGAPRGGFIYSEANATRSRDNVQIAPGTAIRVATLTATRTDNGFTANYDPAGSNGLNTVTGIAFDTYDASSTTGLATGTPVARGVRLSRDAEVNKAELDWNGMTTGQQATAITALTALGIVVREGV